MTTPESVSPSKRQLQGAASREEILDAATRLMSAQGYDGTSMAELAKESGLPPSSIYWHFTSKQGVLEAVMARGAERFFGDAPAPAELASENPRVMIGGALARASASMQAHPEFLRLFILLLVSTDPAHTAHHDVVRTVRQAGRDRLHAMLIDAYGGLESPTAHRVADRLADFAQGMFDGAFLAIQYDPELSHLVLMEQMTEAVVALGDQIAAET